MLQPYFNMDTNLKLFANDKHSSLFRRSDSKEDNFFLSNFKGLYYKTLQILNLQKNGKFRSKHTSLDMYTNLDKQTCELTTGPKSGQFLTKSK